MKYGVNMTNPLVSFLEGFNNCRENLNKSFQWRTKVRSIRYINPNCKLDLSNFENIADINDSELRHTVV